MNLSASEYQVLGRIKAGLDKLSPVQRRLPKQIRERLGQGWLLKALNTESSGALARRLRRQAEADARSTDGSKQCSHRYDETCLHDILPSGIYDRSSHGDEYSLTAGELSERLAELVEKLRPKAEVHTRN